MHRLDIGADIDKMAESGMNRFPPSQHILRHSSAACRMLKELSSSFSNMERAKESAVWRYFNACHANYFDGCLQCLQIKCFDWWWQYCKVQYYHLIKHIQKHHAKQHAEFLQLN